MGGLIRHRGVQIKTTENHEIQPHLQGALQLQVAQPAPPLGIGGANNLPGSSWTP